MKNHWILLLFLLIAQEDPFQARRIEMVETQIAARGIKNPEVLMAMRKVPRHLLVPKELAEYAYQDRPLPIGEGQTISQPYMVAYMTSLIQPKNDMKVLEIGTGSGYQAAVLAEIVDKVYSVEIIASLGEKAQEDLKNLGYKNVRVKIGDGFQGWPERGPFDAILVTAAAESPPAPLLAQLKEGGIMIIPIGSQDSIQELVRLENKNGKIKTTRLGAVRFVPFTREK
ncbi:protein-L-isoaspartate(D-aspartate) O-methyltransferase [Pararhodonellum marinum]|uniref:protein-L-isoaspartate(D-aspartate) O-methyltransferase n=1 Tax=Pararhodonellum marinum TaxID=2755358 RepID=UPI001890ADBB|nr:protein-L-isoaspartate(D-aspartate) O-methyltransferase [Pararhodonellum marinum]